MAVRIKCIQFRQRYLHYIELICQMIDAMYAQKNGKVVEFAGDPPNVFRFCYRHDTHSRLSSHRYRGTEATGGV